jgi:hypothetical protein
MNENGHRSSFMSYLAERKKERLELPKSLADFGRRIDIAYMIARMALWGAQPPFGRRYYIGAWRVNRRRQPIILRIVRSKPRWVGRPLRRIRIEIPDSPLWQDRKEAIEKAVACYRIAREADHLYLESVRRHAEERHRMAAIQHDIEGAVDEALRSRHLLYEQMREDKSIESPVVSEGMIADWWEAEPDEIPIRLA